MSSHKSTLPNSSIGLDSEKIDERRIEEQVYRHLAKQDTTGIAESPVPKGTVAPAHELRKRILQLSLAPDVYMNRHLKMKGASRLG